MKQSAVNALKSPAAIAAALLACWAVSSSAASPADWPAPKADSPVAPAASPAPATAPAAPLVSSAPKDPDTLEAITTRMLAARKSMIELEAKIVERSRRIQAMFDGYNKAERNLTGFNGLGRVEQMELKADLYGGERMARKKLAEEFASLSDLIEDWSALKGKLREDQRLLALRKQIIDLKKGADSKSSGGSSVSDSKSLTDIEYYQVKKDADLRTISSYPEVYGTPEFWDYLYKANKDKLQDPDKPVPAGTTLIVPQDVKKLPDFNDL